MNNWNPYDEENRISAEGSNEVPYSGTDDTAYVASDEQSAVDMTEANGRAAMTENVPFSDEVKENADPEPEDVPAGIRNAEPVPERSEERTGEMPEWKSAKPEIKAAEPVPAPKKSKSGTGRKIALAVLLAAVFGVVAGAMFLGITKLGQSLLSEETAAVTEEAANDPLPDRSTVRPFQNKSDGETDLPSTEKPEEAEPAISKPNTSGASINVEDVVDIAMPSMVSITGTTVEEVRSFFGGQTQQFEAQVAGSGVIIEKTDEAFLIATNEHITNGTESLAVAFCDDSVAPGTLVGANANEDLAIISVAVSDLSEETRNAIRVIAIGNSDECRVGQQVVAIGNALGYGQSVSTGIISALNREFQYDNTTHYVMQTDAAINPGNSGGALLNMNGELIGINEAKYAKTEVEGIGYAIPIATAEPILSTLIERDTRESVPEEERGILGITCISIPEQYVQQGYPAGAYVDSVVEGLGAARSGLQEGDIITAVDGYTVASADELVKELGYYKAGDTVELTISRMYNNSDGFGSLNVTVTLSDQSELPEETQNG